jgi:SAM-dependent methyltransferase
VNSDHLRQVELVYGSAGRRISEAVEQSLHPRGPDLMLDLAAAYLHPDSLVLDIGCRHARYLIELVQAHGCRGVGLDPVDVERARAAVNEAGLGGRIEIKQGVMQQIKEPNDHFDLVWCRDMLELVDPLDRGLAEAARVLRLGGAMLVYTNFATELLAPAEAAMIHAPLGHIEANFDEDAMEAAFRRAGFLIARKDVIGTEWREHDEEHAGSVSRDLLRLARLRRKRRELVAEHGQKLYDLAQASLQWRTFQLLGKLRPTLYVLELPV